MNCYESGQQKVIPAVLVYVFCGAEVLLLHRVTRNVDQDIHAQKYNGLGGKLEWGEAPRAAAIREVYEESGLILIDSQLKELGVLQFPNFKSVKNEDWIVWLMRVDLDQKPTLAQLNQPGSEGILKWMPVSALLDLPLWEGDRQFLPFVLRSQPCMGSLWYENLKLVKTEIRELHGSVG